MKIKSNGMNTRFVYNEDKSRITGTEFDISFELDIKLDINKPEKYEYLRLLNQAYDEFKDKIQSMELKK
jgi:hypothetical protein